MQNIALVGFGFMGQLHAQVYHQLSNAAIAGIVDTRADESRAALEKLGIDAPVYGSLADLLEASEKIDAVDVCLPTDLHHAVVLEAFAAGKSVFCEKPISTSVAKAEEMVAAAAEAGRAATEKTGSSVTLVQLMVGHCIRFWPEYQAVTDFVNAGTGGKLVSLNLQRFGGRPGYTIDNWINDEERCHGAALDMHIHDTDYLLHLLGKPNAVFSRGVREPAGWNYISTNFLYDDVPVVTAEGGWILPSKWGFRMTLKAVFENAAIDFDSSKDPTLTLTLGDDDPAPMPFTVPASSSDAAGAGNISDLGGYYNELEYFIDRLENNQPIDINTGDHALASLKAALAEIESASTGEIISIT